MPEPTTTATTTIVSASVAMPALSVLGIPLGLRPDLLIAGFAGSLVAIILLNTVPSLGDTWQLLLRTSLRRMAVACASSVTAGYMTPLLLLMAAVPEPLLLSMAFLAGVGAQRLLVAALARFMTPELRPGRGDAA